MTSDSPTATPYRVLARKYRPQNFDQLIGQDALVRTLKNAITSGRIAHAYMLTGVRGVGKTTTARIIAKALNYKGPDGTSGPTTGPTDDCALCRAIAEDRHPDVMEMDAASRTGVDDIREIIDGMRYAPSEARYKIYIIDEVHMLSKNAFNALLKTLEEPPEHVKFIFATTEIRKVPVTVLSRCQRFDLRRVDAATLHDHFQKICDLESVQAEADALALIARAADGSVRDGLSLLDQAISLGGAQVSAQQVKDMLGLGDRAQTLDMLEFLLKGKTAEGLQISDDLFRAGVDPLVLVQDLLDLVHLLTRLRAVPKSGSSLLTPDMQNRCAALAASLSMPSLGKAWQILLKGITEVQHAPQPQNAAEIILIRLAYAADLPDPVDLLRRLKDQPESTAQAPLSTVSPPISGGSTARTRTNGSATALAISEPLQSSVPAPRTLEDVVALLDQGGEPLLASQVYHGVHLIKMEEGRLEIRPHEDAPPQLAQDLGAKLSVLTGQRWIVSISREVGAATLAQQAQGVRAAEFEKILQMPLIQAIVDTFPGTKLVDIRDKKD
ncbi:MAG: DNA polymerase III subunit gamma/tau [Alphaproteobacteria bacterium]|nr:DNA polymerase III subunit gamma/tau [Alphaproteobacteria bacterium]